MTTTFTTVQNDKDSQTIRQQPNNYMLAHWDSNKRAWAMEPDLAADKDLVVALTLSLMDHANKYSRDPINAILGMSDYMSVGHRGD